MLVSVCVCYDVRVCLETVLNLLAGHDRRRLPGFGAGDGDLYRKEAEDSMVDRGV